MARGKKGGQVPPRRAREDQLEGPLHEEVPLRKTGVYRLRYSYQGSSLVAAGRVTERIRIRRRIFFG